MQRVCYLTKQLQFYEIVISSIGISNIFSLAVAIHHRLFYFFARNCHFYKLSVDLRRRISSARIYTSEVVWCIR